MTVTKAIYQLNDLIKDRKSFLDGSQEEDSVFHEDIEALQIAVESLITPEKIKTIADHYGEEKQLMQTVEEMSELTLAICRLNAVQTSYRRYKKFFTTDKIVEELADVYIMISQLVYLLSDEQRKAFDGMVTAKLDRQLGRIEKERKK